MNDKNPQTITELKEKIPKVIDNIQPEVVRAGREKLQRPRH